MTTLQVACCREVPTSPVLGNQLAHNRHGATPITTAKQGKVIQVVVPIELAWLAIVTIAVSKKTTHSSYSATRSSHSPTGSLFPTSRPYSLQIGNHTPSSTHYIINSKHSLVCPIIVFDLISHHDPMSREENPRDQYPR